MRIEIEMACGITDYDHFSCIHIKDRPMIWDMLQSIQDGDYWENIYDDSIKDIDYMSLSDEEWHDLLLDVSQRGTFELVKTEIIIDPDIYK